MGFIVTGGILEGFYGVLVWVFGEFVGYFDLFPAFISGYQAVPKCLPTTLARITAPCLTILSTIKFNLHSLWLLGLLLTGKAIQLYPFILK